MLLPASRNRIFKASKFFVGQPIISLAFLLVAATSATAATDISTRNELILAIQLEENSLESDILGYQQSDEFFLSLRELSQSLQFPISVDAESGLAGGWFIREEREFSLDLPTSTVISNGTTYSIPKSAAFIAENDIFVSTPALERWFPLEFDVNTLRLSVNIKTLEELPIEQYLKRSLRRVNSPVFTRRDPELPLKPAPYGAIGHRATDARISVASSRRDDDADVTRRTNLSLLSRGDLAWMTSTLFLAANEDDLNSARLTLERTEFDGPLGLNHVEVGDVVNTVGSGNRGIGIRGGTVQGSADGRYSDDTIDLDGDILPGWQVELYRNGVLIEFQEVGENGRYNFTDVPLVFGENNFEFVFYDPYGEVRKETVTHFVGAGVLGAGNLAYELSATQAQRSVFDVGPAGSSTDKDSAIYNADFNLGITRNLSTGVRLKSYEQDEQRRENSDFSLNFSTAYFQVRSSYGQRDTDYDRLTTSLRSRVGAAGLSGSFTEYSDSGLEEEFIDDNPRLWSASFSTDLAVPVLPVNLSTTYLKRERSESATGLLSTTYTATQSTRLSTNVAYSWANSRDNGGDISQQTSGGLSISTISRPWIVRSYLNYYLYPDAELTYGGLSATVALKESISMNMDMERNFQSETTIYRAGYNWDFDTFRISPQISYDSNERYTGLLTISTNFTSRPDNAWPVFDRFSLANHGGVMARAFIDENGNGELDAGEQPLENVDFHAQQSFRKATTDEQGRAWLHRLPAYRQTDIRMDEGTLPNAEQQSQAAGNSVLPRPGHWQTHDFPVIVTADLEGTVRMQQTAAGDRQPVSRALVLLKNDQGETLRSQRTAYDGLYIFAKVPPGVYELVLAESTEGRVISSPGTLAVTSDQGLYQGLDMLLAPQANNVKPLAPTPERPAIVPESSINDSTQKQSSAVPDQQPKTTEQEDQINRTWFVQVGAYSSRANAQEAWNDLQARSKLLGNKTEIIQKPGRYFRLLAGPGMPETSARELCEALKENGIDCLARSVP